MASAEPCKTCPPLAPPMFCTRSASDLLAMASTSNDRDPAVLVETAVDKIPDVSEKQPAAMLTASQVWLL